MGSRFHSSIISQNPWAVVVPYKEPFGETPIAVTGVFGTYTDVTCSVHPSRTSPANNSSKAVPLFYWASTRGLS